MTVSFACSELSCGCGLRVRRDPGDATFTLAGPVRLSPGFARRLLHLGIKGPAGYGFLGSLADHGVAEFLLILHQR